MDYQLALQLKEAGFPQTESSGEYYDFQGRKTDASAGPSIHNPETGIATSDIRPYLPIPNLEELIEACGDIFLGIHTPEKGIWWADTKTHECDCGKEECSGFNHKVEKGSTPIEAVARLWLALHTKQ